MHGEADDIALEQVRHWRTYMTAQEAAVAVGLGGNIRDWVRVARHLAVMWREMQAGKAENVLKRAA